MQNAGVEMDKNGCVKVDDHLRTNVPHIWALGDVIGRIELTPVALMEGMTFANNCFGEQPRVPDYGSLASAVRHVLHDPLSAVPELSCSLPGD